MRKLLCIACLLFASVGCGKPEREEPVARTASTTKPAPVHSVLDLEGAEVDPFEPASEARVFVFVTTDCPIANRYAPELERMYQEFTKRGVEFSLVYPNAADTVEKIIAHKTDYGLTARPLRDSKHTLARKVGVTVTPEAAVFDAADKLVYCGRIDDWYVDFGKNRKQPTTHELRDAVDAVIAGEPVAAPRVKAVGCYISELDE